MERVLQCVAFVGIVSNVRISNTSTCSSVTLRGSPGRGSSSNPSTPNSMNLRRHLPTVDRVIPRPSATAVLLLPSTQASTIRARNASACAWSAAASIDRASRARGRRITAWIGRPLVTRTSDSMHDTSTVWIMDLRLRTLGQSIHASDGRGRKARSSRRRLAFTRGGRRRGGLVPRPVRACRRLPLHRKPP